MSNTQTKKLKTADGTVVYFLDGKMQITTLLALQ